MSEHSPRPPLCSLTSMPTLPYLKHYFSLLHTFNQTHTVTPTSFHSHSFPYAITISRTTSVSTAPPPSHLRRAISLIEEDTRVNSLWQSISTHDRRTIFDDVIRKLRGKEMEQEREMRERCKVKFSALVESMPAIVYNTTWKEVRT